MTIFTRGEGVFLKTFVGLHQTTMLLLRATPMLSISYDAVYTYVVETSILVVVMYVAIVYAFAKHVWYAN
jgi:hypothetical protein